MGLYRTRVGVSSRLRFATVVGAALASAAAVIVAVPSAAQAGPHKPAPRIVLQRTVPDRSEQVFVSDRRGTHQRQLTDGPSWGIDPRWGPFGHRILYLRRPPNDQHFPDLMVMGARGRHKQRLLAGRRGYFITDMAWGPAGGRVVFAASRPGGASGFSDLFMYSLRTRKVTRLHVNSVPDRDPSTVDWSRDGRTIAFSAVDYTDDDGFEDHDLYLMRPDGTELRQITNTDLRDEWRPRLSPDGARIVYSRHSGNCAAIVIAASDGSRPRRVRVGCDATQASWSSGGHRLLVEKEDPHNDEGRIWSTALDGSHRRFITPGSNASWRPR